MKWLKLFGITVVAICSLGIAATSAAQAVELKFLPEKAKFGFRSSGVVTFRTLGGKGIECEKVTGSGEGTSQRTGTIELKCVNAKDLVLGTTCTGLSDVAGSGNITVNGTYDLRHLLAPQAEDVNLAILVTSVHFSCLGILFVVSGCVASDDLKKNVTELWLKGEKVTSFVVNFLVKAANEKGDALVTLIDTDTSAGMETCELKTKQEGGANESSSLEGTGTVENCTVGGNACEFVFDLK